MSRAERGSRHHPMEEEGGIGRTKGRSRVVIQLPPKEAPPSAHPPHLTPLTPRLQGMWSGAVPSSAGLHRRALLLPPVDSRLLSGIDLPDLAFSAAWN
ncbi:hypothetical protein NDU88_012234 [Pleurodeles waltl]|uniref:Uncharacterized protein n=1 Tax=Pleurodeles waltl TaxID=8319 RepID=A0AAV7R033_PLEWA|nr:hypothetical protein NDU88_012234 [Pleurodeles waltl]